MPCPKRPQSVLIVKCTRVTVMSAAAGNSMQLVLLVIFVVCLQRLENMMKCCMDTGWGDLTNCSRLEAHLRCRVSSCQHCTHGTCSRRCTAPPATTAATPPAGECQNQQRYQSPASDARSPTLVNGRVYSYKALCHSVVVESHHPDWPSNTSKTHACNVCTSSARIPRPSRLEHYTWDST